jgi:hypothetical protein
LNGVKSSFLLLIVNFFMGNLLQDTQPCGLNLLKIVNKISTLSVIRAVGVLENIRVIILNTLIPNFLQVLLKQGVILTNESTLNAALSSLLNLLLPLFLLLLKDGLILLS